MKKIWFDEAWEEYLYWQTQDKKIMKWVNAFLKDIERGIMKIKKWEVVAKGSFFFVSMTAKKELRLADK